MGTFWETFPEVSCMMPMRSGENGLAESKQPACQKDRYFPEELSSFGETDSNAGEIK